jgi:prepilin-type N-terminal cleavage/methylation domain-containing protein
MLFVTRRSGDQSRGFTLIELVAAIVILGVVTAVAVQVFRDLRYDARKAALESVRATMVANYTAARTAWLTQGHPGASTVMIGGRAVEVFGGAIMDAGGVPMPAGAPTADGMYRMLGCGTGTPVALDPNRCDALPGMLVTTGGGGRYISVWHEAIANDPSIAYCYVNYSADAGVASPEGVIDEWSGWSLATEYWYYPISAVGPGGC